MTAASSMKKFFKLAERIKAKTIIITAIILMYTRNFSNKPIIHIQYANEMKQAVMCIHQLHLLIRFTADFVDYVINPMAENLNTENTA